MTAELDLFSSPASCACCAGESHSAPLPVPERDLCCEGCGRAIFLKPVRN
ncbi:MAG: hypothetical protein WDN24_12620 [Sphingomonas sp.]